MQAQNHEGFCPALLVIASNAAQNESVRLVSAIALKNIIKKRWNATALELERRGWKPISEADRGAIMTNLHGILIRCGGHK
jgi:hypothetical protein